MEEEITRLWKLLEHYPDNSGQNGSDEYEKSLPQVQPLEVIKAEQTLVFDDLIDRSVGDFLRTCGTVKLGLPVTFTLSDLSLASIKGNSVTVRNAGELTVTATQAGNRPLLCCLLCQSQSFTIGFGNLFADSMGWSYGWMQLI